MAYDNPDLVSYRLGEKDVLEGQFTGIAPATATISSGSTFTIYTSFGTILAGFNGIPVTGYDTGASLTEGKVWYNLDTSGFAPGIYYGVFFFTITGSDTIVRNEKPDIQFVVLSPVEVIANYNPATLAGLVRTLSRDTDMLNPINDDATVDAMIMMSGYNGLSSDLWSTLGDISGTALNSAANCFDLMARDAAKLALIEKIGALSENTKVTYDALREEADAMRKRAANNFVPSDVSCYVPPIEFLPYSIPIVDYGGYTIPKSALDRW